VGETTAEISTCHERLSTPDFLKPPSRTARRIYVLNPVSSFPYGSLFSPNESSSSSGFAAPVQEPVLPAGVGRLGWWKVFLVCVKGLPSPGQYRATGSRPLALLAVSRNRVNRECRECTRMLWRRYYPVLFARDWHACNPTFPTVFLFVNLEGIIFRLPKTLAFAKVFEVIGGLLVYTNYVCEKLVFRFQAFMKPLS
jgi:hypothetical protein